MRSFVLVVCVSAFAGCFSTAPSDEAGPAALPGALAPPCDIQTAVYLIDDTHMPDADGELVSLALNIDGGDDGYPQNQGAFFVYTIDAATLVNTMLRGALDDGSLTWALRIDTCVDDGAYARVYAYQALVGAEDIAVDSEGTAAVGKIVAGVLDAQHGIGEVPLSALFSPGPAAGPIQWSDGDGVHMNLTYESDDSLSGVFAAGLRDDRLAVVPRVLASYLTDTLADGFSLFDPDGDGVVTEQEVVDSMVLYSDIDLFAPHDGQAAYWPSQDGAGDRMSMGFQIHASRVFP